MIKQGAEGPKALENFKAVSTAIRFDGINNLPAGGYRFSVGGLLSDELELR